MSAPFAGSLPFRLVCSVSCDGSLRPTERPAGSTFFVLEEEVLLPSEPVHVHVSRDAEENPAMRGRMILSSLDPARRLLRLSWGPLLALWFSLLAIGAGVGVLLAALRLSSVR